MKSLILLLAFVGLSLATPIMKKQVVQMPIKRMTSVREKLIKQGKWQEYAAQKEASRASGGHPVIDYDDLAYVGTVQTGTPPQDFDMILDTGSANYWMVDSTCNSAACNGQGSGRPRKKYNAGASSTYRNDGRSWQIQYGTGSASGILAIDRLCMAGLCYDTQTFGRATQIAQFFQQEPIDGILGMGWPALAVQNVIPPMHNLLPQLDMPAFTVWLDVKGLTEGNVGGLYTYGDLDRQNCDMSTLKYTALTSQTYWQFAIQSVSAGTYTNNQVQQVISDTGTSFMAGPQSQIDGICRALGGTYDAQNQLYRVPCSNQNSNNLDVTFTINIVGGGSTPYAIPAKEHVVDLGLGNGQCFLAFFAFGGGGFGPAWIMGDPFIRTHCNVYHIGNAQLGMALAKH